LTAAKTNPAKPDRRLAAVCGLFCPACTVFIATSEDPERLKMLAYFTDLPIDDMRCYGCHSDKRNPYSEYCKMMKCAAEKGIEFCFECEQYPCEDLKIFQAALPHRIELWKNLERIKEVGYDKWYREMIDHYSCPKCHTLNSAYDITCRKCGASPGNAYVEQNREEILAQLAKMMPPGSEE
jgi:hypothetical protein